MKKRVLAFLVLLVLIAVQGAAIASNFYIIPDSDTRRLTRDELWQWQYDALGYILNEIFARHGMEFKTTGKYYAYFNSQSWYDPTSAYDPNTLSNLEWDNEKLVKDVRAEMRSTGDYNPSGKPVPKVEPPMNNIPWGFREEALTSGQKLDVYSGPGTNYVRGADGKARVSTNGSVYTYGWENGWLMLLYRLDSGGGRIGYVDGSRMTGSSDAPIVQFSYQDTAVLYACSLTDDPMIAGTPLANLKQGAQVTFLCWLQNNNDWAYVEANTAAGPARGCIPADAIDIANDEEVGAGS